MPGPDLLRRECQDTDITGTPLPTTDVRVIPAADQIARNCTADVILGGGLSRFDAADEKALRRQGYAVLGSPASQSVATRNDLRNADSRKVFGPFNKGNLTIEKFKRENPTVQNEPSTLTNPEAAGPPANADAGNPSNSSKPARTASVKDPSRSTGPVNGSGSGDPRNFASATFRTVDDPPSVKDGSPEANLWLAYLSGKHTGEDVPVFAYGPRSSMVGNSIENTELLTVVTDALRLRR